MSDTDIRYLKREEIDVQKWDRCIDDSPNRMIYGYSYYLDQMAKHWEALVMADYSVVMPLIWNKKFGIKYLYQPAFTQQLGIFSPDEINSSVVDRFLTVIVNHFRFGEIFFNYGNPHPSFRKHTNYIIGLNTFYEELYSTYKRDAVKNLKRAEKFQLKYSEYANLEMALDMYRKEYGTRMPQLKSADYNNFKKLCSLAREKGEIIIKAVLDDKNNLLAVAILLQKNNRLFLIQSTTLASGRKIEANYFLLDRLIQEYAGRDMVLDFEGSDIPGIAHFYSNFGGLDQPYFFYRFNRLPFWIKWMKPG